MLEESWGRKVGKESRFFLKGSAQKYEAGCQRDAFKGIMSLCHHISTTRLQGNEIHLHTPTCQSDPPIEGS